MDDFVVDKMEMSKNSFIFFSILTLILYGAATMYTLYAYITSSLPPILLLILALCLLGVGIVLYILVDKIKIKDE